MQYRKLGNSGLKVSAVGLGGNNFGWWADEATSIAVIDRAIGLGINYIDTADMYDKGRSEEFIGKAIKGKRLEAIIGTKFSSPMGEGPNERGGSRHYITRALEASLRRLQTDYIDLYQMHGPDPTTPIEETLRALDDAVRAGKVRYIGCSNFAAWQLCQALWTSRANSLNSFVTVQSQYNLTNRQIEAELVPCCQAYGVGVIPWAPLAGGLLTGKYRQGEKPAADTRFSMQNTTYRYTTYSRVLADANWDKLAKLEAFAKERGHTMGELAIGWLLAKPYICTVIAGARKPEQVDANVAAGSWKLTPEEVVQVDGIA